MPVMQLSNIDSLIIIFPVDSNYCVTSLAPTRYAYNTTKCYTNQTMAPRISLAKTIPVPVLLPLLLSAINSQGPGVLARSTGPPASEPEYHDLVCDRMVPYHAQNDPQPGNGGYLIETDLPLSLNSVTGFTYLAGRTYKGKVGVILPH